MATKPEVSESAREKAMEYALQMHQNRDYAVDALVADARVIEGYLTGASDPPAPSQPTGQTAEGPTISKPN